MKKNATEKEPTTINHKKKTTNKNTIEQEQGSKILIHLTTKSIVKFRLFGLAFVFLGYLFFSTLDVIYLIFTAAIIAISMEGIIVFFEKKTKHRILAISISYFFLILFLVSGFIFIIPFLISQTSQLISWISYSIGDLKLFILNNTRPDAINNIGRLPGFIKDYVLSHRSDFEFTQADFQATLLSNLNALLDSSVLYLKQLSTGFFGFIGSLFSIFGELAITFTLAIFFSIEREYLVKLVTKCFSESKKTAVYKKINRVYTQLGIRLKARLLLSLFLAVAIGIALGILKLCGIYIPSIFSLALITGLLDIIPYVGPLLACIPIALLALVHNGFWAMIIVGCIFIAIQRVQENIITPLLMGQQLGVNSLLILISALLGAVIMGFRGIILSVPLAVLIGLFIDDDEK